jgi:hypothetical protein
MPTSVKHLHDDMTAKPLINHQKSTLTPQKPNSETAAKAIFSKTTAQSYT